MVLSELAHYFDKGDLRRIMDHLMGSTVAGSHVIGAPWRGPTDYPLTAEAAHELIGTMPGLKPIVLHQEPAFMLEVWECLP
ncbi:MAG TPA: hypothetical protein VGG38_18385 [Acidimicrobiales bacterium]